MAETGKGVIVFDIKNYSSDPVDFGNPGWLRIAYFSFLFLAAVFSIGPSESKADYLQIPVGISSAPVITTNFNLDDAPEFPQNLQWLNTTKPIRLAELRGKVVLLNFWTYGNIKCLHVLPDLTELESKYPDELVVIGVHSGKFSGEKNTENIRQALDRHSIRYPVVNDSDMKIWNIYGVHAWPALILIDPSGRIVNRYTGEDVFGVFDENIASLIKQFDRIGLLQHKPFDLAPETDRQKDSTLYFPGGILADEASGKLFVSDTGHNRIIVARFDGSILEIYGSGDRGFLDGPFDLAKFNQPRGLALSNRTLYVADTGNHSIRAVNLSIKKVTTLAGTGRQGKSLNIKGKTSVAALNSPWDLEVIGDKLFVAMAGAHQLYRIDLQNDTIYLFAGEGFEGHTDGLRRKAALAQPSGLATDGNRLFFTDSQSSSVRWIDTRGNSVVTTIVGRGLYQFGDKDGSGHDVLMQHPMGLSYYSDLLFVADTYNNKIKVIDPSTASVGTFLGNGTAGNVDEPVPLFNEPGDISSTLGMLFIADTNNHSIRVADIRTRKVKTLELKMVSKN